MSYQLTVLRAMMRLARRRSPIDIDQLALRAGGEASDVRAALRALAGADLVERTPEGARLTLSGLAVALASNGRWAMPRPVEERMPLARRRSRAA